MASRSAPTFRAQSRESTSIPARQYARGKSLVELDTRQERAQLASLEAQRDLARVNFGRMQQLVNEGVISRMEYDQAAAQQKATEANVAEIRATIERKTIRAPFSGILGIRKINLGQYLPAGSPVVSNESLNPIYVNVSVPQQATRQIQVGRKLHVTAEDAAGQVFTGNVTAIDSQVDETTRNIQIQATLSNPEGKLRPGMFVQVEIPLGASRNGDRAAGLGHQLCPVRGFCLRDHRSQRSEGQDISRSAAAVRQD